MICKIILGVVILYLILNIVLFFMKLYERKLDKDINVLIKELRADTKNKK